MTALPIVLMSDDEVAGYGQNPDAGFGSLRTERGLLPLAALQVDARVIGVVASIEIAQTFVNTTGSAIEATYIFPLPDRAAVHAFRMEVAGRIIEGVIDERGAARQHYDEAIAAGHRAAITEEDRAGVFTMRVGNLLAGESAIVRLSLVGPLPVDDGEVTFRFPLVVAPRYMPGSELAGDQAGLGSAADTALVPDASRISPPVRLPGCTHPVRLGLRVTLEDRAIREVASSLHTVIGPAASGANRDAHVIDLVPGERLDRDFILRWRIDGKELGSSLVCSDDADGHAGTFQLTLVPPSTNTLAAKPRDVVFVIDRSGSMGGWKMIAARRAAARMIDTLTSRDRFCAIAFDTATELLPDPHLSPASDRNRFRAVEGLARVEARGGTELAEPLRRATSLLAGGHDDRERMIVLVTDGQVGNEDHILRELVPSLKNVRMCTLGIDQAVNAAFLRRLAAAGGGLCELVESEDRLDAVMTKVHRRIGTPIATDLAIAMRGIDLDRASIAPHKLPDVYAGAPVVIHGRYRGSASAGAAADITGTQLGDPLHVHVDRTVDGQPQEWLAPSWARAHIRDLEDRYAVDARGEIEQQIIAVSKRFAVLSRFTAFLAVDRSEIANRGGKLQQIVQPVEQPAGWQAPAERLQGLQTPTGVLAIDMLAGAGGAARGAAMPASAALPVSSRATMSAPGMLGMAKPGAIDAKASTPPAQLSPPIVQRLIRAKRESAARDEGAIDRDTGEAYGLALAGLARELEAQARGRVDAAVVRILRQRLTEWIEDVRSVGGHETLAKAVEDQVRRMSAALAGTAGALATELLAVAAALVALSTGRSPPATPTRSRLAFWK